MESVEASEWSLRAAAEQLNVDWSALQHAKDAGIAELKTPNLASLKIVQASRNEGRQDPQLA